MSSIKKQVGRVLIVDDREDTLKALAILLRSNSFDFKSASSPAAALELIQAEPFDVVLMDLNYSRDTTSGREGMDLLGQIRSIDSQIAIAVMTAWSSVEIAVEAMRRGANDFVEKPWENERLLSILKTQIELVQAKRDGQRLQAENERLEAMQAALADGEKQAIIEQAAALAQRPATPGLVVLPFHQLLPLEP